MDSVSVFSIFQLASGFPKVATRQNLPGFGKKDRVGAGVSAQFPKSYSLSCSKFFFSVKDEAAIHCGSQRIEKPQSRSVLELEHDNEHDFKNWSRGLAAPHAPVPLEMDDVPSTRQIHPAAPAQQTLQRPSMNSKATRPLIHRGKRRLDWGLCRARAARSSNRRLS
jgi:hypothetical protein